MRQTTLWGHPMQQQSQQQQRPTTARPLPMQQQQQDARGGGGGGGGRGEQAAFDPRTSTLGPVATGGLRLQPLARSRPFTTNSQPQPSSASWPAATTHSHPLSQPDPTRTATAWPLQANVRPKAASQSQAVWPDQLAAQYAAPPLARPPPVSRNLAASPPLASMTEVTTGAGSAMPSAARVGSTVPSALSLAAPQGVLAPTIAAAATAATAATPPAILSSLPLEQVRY